MKDFLDRVIKTKAGTWRAIDIQVKCSILREFGILKLIWGTDIWINNVPVLKCFIAANILVWILLFVFAR